MKKGIFLGFVLVSSLLIACGNGKKADNESVLSGQLSGLTTKQLYLIDLLQPKAGPVDTAIVAEDGTFAFDYEPKIKGFYRVTLSEQMNLILPLAEGEEVVVSGNVNGSESIQVEGTDDAVRMMEFNQFLQGNFAEQQKMNEEFQQLQSNPNQDSIVNEFRMKYQAMEEEKYQLIKELIDEDPGLFANLALIEQLPADLEDHLDYYNKVDEALGVQYSESRFYQNFSARLKDMRRFAPGSVVPEIKLPNPEGDTVSLSSLRGKVVLIDFWASWCKPCRRENPNVVAAYERFKDKGFTIFGVSLDRSKEAWVRAIKQDNLNWTQVSDLKFWQSEAAQDYGVSGIPFALLIDEEGKVIGKNLRGRDLHKKLEEVLN